MNDALFVEHCTLELFSELVMAIHSEANQYGEEIPETTYFGRSIKSILKEANALLEDARKALNKGKNDWEDRYDKALLFLVEQNKAIAYGLQNIEARYPYIFDNACYEVNSEDFFQNVGAVEFSAGLNPYDFLGIEKPELVKDVINSYIS